MKKLIVILALVGCWQMASAQKIQSSSTQPSGRAASVESEEQSSPRRTKKPKKTTSLEEEFQTIDSFAELPDESGTDLGLSSNSNSNSSANSIIQTSVNENDLIAEPVRPSFHLTPVAGASFFNIDGNVLRQMTVNNLPITFGAQQSQFSNELEMAAGFTGGLLAEYSKADSRFGFETGLIYTQVNAQGDNSNSGNPFVTNARVNQLTNDYLYLPLNIKFYPVKRDNVAIHIKAGVLGGYLLSSTLDHTNGSFAFNGTSGLNVISDSSENFNSSDFQGNIGLGGKFGVSDTMAFALEAAYQTSFSNISSTSVPTEAKNQGFTTTAGLVIGL